MLRDCVWESIRKDRKKVTFSFYFLSKLPQPLYCRVTVKHCFSIMCILFFFLFQSSVIFEIVYCLHTHPRPNKSAHYCLGRSLFSAAFRVKYSRLNLMISDGLLRMTSLEKSLRISGSSSGTTIYSAEKILISRTSAILLLVLNFKLINYNQIENFIAFNQNLK